MFHLAVNLKLIAIALAVSLLFPSFALPMQLTPQASEWIIVKSIPQGQYLLIQLKTGKNIKGALRSATESDLELLVKGSPVRIGIAEVLRIYRVRGRQMVKGALIGAAVGAGAGAVTGAATYRKSGWLDFGRGFNAAVGGGAGLVIGTVTGLLIGVFWHKKNLVYEASPAR